MYNDGKCYIWLPSFLTLSTLSEEAAATINAVHTALGLPTGLTAGGTNPYILPLNDLDMGGAPFTRGSGGELACCGPIDNRSFLSLQQLALMVAFGGDVEGFPVWFRFDDPTDECPFSDSAETWETWGVFGVSHKPVQIGDYWYRSSAVGESGALMLASQWVGAMQQGLAVLTQDEYMALQQEG